MLCQIFTADATGGRIGIEGAIRIGDPRFQSNGIADTQWVGVVGDIVDRVAVHIQRDRVDPDGNGRGRHRHPQCLVAVGILIDGDQNVIHISAAIHRAVKGFAAAVGGKVSGIGISYSAVRLGFRRGDIACLQIKTDICPKDGLDRIHLHVLTDGVHIQDVTAVDRVIVFHLGGALGGTGDAVDDTAESIPEGVGIIRRKIGIRVIERGGVIRVRRHVHRILLVAGLGILHGWRTAGKIFLPGGIDRVHRRHISGGKVIGIVPVAARFQNQVGHCPHPLVLLRRLEADGKYPGTLSRLRIRIVMGRHSFFEIGRRDQRQEAVSAVGGIVIPRADGGIFNTRPPFAAGGCPGEGGGRTVRHHNQVGHTGDRLAVLEDIGIGGVEQHLHALINPGMNIGVGIQRYGGGINIAGHLHIAVVAVIGAGGGIPAGDGQIVLVRSDGNGAQVQHGLGAAVEYHNSHPVLVIGLRQGTDCLVDAVHHGLYPAFRLGGHGAAAVLVLAPGHAGGKVQHKNHIHRRGGFGNDLGGGCQR